MRFTKKKQVWFGIDIGVLLLSTDVKEPIRGQFGLANKLHGRNYFGGPVLTIFMNFKTLNKVLSVPGYAKVQFTSTCPLCRVPSRPSWSTRTKYFGKHSVEFVLLPNTTISDKFNGKTYLLSFCSKVCKENYALNPLGVNIPEIYGIK